MADDLGTQLGIQNEINKVLVAREAIMKRNASLLQGQAQLAKELCNALRCENLDGIEERLQGIRDAMEDAADAAQNAGSEFNSATDEIGRMVDELDDASTSAKNLDSRVRKFASAAAVFKTVGGAITGAFSATFKAVTGVLSLGPKLFGSVVALANEAASAGRAMAEAFEEVREQFGDLATGEGLAVTEAFHDIDKAASEFGVNLGSRFGPFIEGSVAKLKAMAAAMENLGSLGPLLERQFTGRVVFAMDSLTKGAGISAEAFQSLANRSLNAGQSLESVLEQTSRSIASVSKSIGVSTKTLGKNFDQIAKDVTNFGHLTVQEMTSLAAVMTKTGISMSTVQGIASKFDQFDSAAESVAKLTQAFGLNLNAIDLLNASDEERLQMLKTSFMEQGKSIDQLSRQERAYLASSAGIAESDLERVFGDQAGSIDETATAAERAQQAQISMAASMQEMEKSIKRVFGPLLQLSGMFSSFFDGFEEAFKLSGILQPLRDTIREIFNLGFASGKDFAFVIKSIIEGMGGMDAVLADFKKPFEYIREFFGDLREGEKFEDAFASLLTKMLNHAEKQIPKFIGFIDNLLLDINKRLQSPGTQKTIQESFNKIFASFDRLLNNPVVKTGLEKASKLLAKIFVGALVFNFVQALPGAIATALSTAFTLGSFKFGRKGAQEAAEEVAEKSSKGIFARLSTKLGKLVPRLGTKLIPGIGLALAIIEGGIAAADFENRIGPKIDEKFDTVGSRAGAKLAGSVLNAVTLGLLPDVVLENVAGAFGTISSGLGKTLDFLGFSGIKNMFVGFFDGIRKLFSGIGTFFSNAFSLNTDSYNKAQGGAESFGEGLGQTLVNIFGKMVFGIPNLIFGAVTLLGKGLKSAGGMRGLLDGLGSFVINIMAGIGSAVKGLLKGILKEMLAQLAGLVNSVISMAQSFGFMRSQKLIDIDKIRGIDKTAAIAASESAAEAIALTDAAIEDTNAVTENMRKLGSSREDATVVMNDFKKGLSTGDSAITIDREKIQFQIGLNVNLVADKLAEALSDRSIVSDEFRLVRSGGGVNV